MMTIHLLANWGVRKPRPNKCSGYDIKQSDGEDPVLELWGMQSTPSLPSLLDPLWLEW